MPNLDDLTGVGKPLNISTKAIKRRPWLDVVDHTEHHNRNTIGTQKEHNRNTIGTQKDDNRNTIGTQKDDNRNTIGTQKEDNRNTIGTQKDDNRNTIGTQKDDNRNTIGTQKDAFCTIVGLRKSIVMCVYRLSKPFDFKETGEINLSLISDDVRYSQGSVKTTVQRLCKDEILIKIDEKKGRNGWVKYKINHTLLPQIKVFLKGTQVSSNPPIYNSNNKLTTITTKEKEENKTPEPVIVDKHEKAEDIQNDSWSNINTSALDEHGISKGFVHNIKKLNTVSAEIAQESINHFGYRLDQGDIPAKWKNPLSVLFGTLKKGGAWVEGGYRSPQEIAEEKRIEMKREELNRKKLRHLEELEIAFEEWSMELSYDEKKAMIGDDTYNATLKLTGAAEAQQWLESELRSKFEMEIYSAPSKAKAIKLDNPAQIKVSHQSGTEYTQCKVTNTVKL